MIKNMAGHVKILVLTIWIIMISATAAYLFLTPDALTAENMANLVSNSGYVLLFYITLTLLRGFILLPSTPFILMGCILFPQSTFTVLSISMAGILLSATLIYFFSHYMGFDTLFEKKFSHKIAYIREKINQPKGILFVMLWSFFPLVPTDLMCYVAGTIKMNFGKFLLAVFIGELPIVAAYVYAGQGIFELVFG